MTAFSSLKIPFPLGKELVRKNYIGEEMSILCYFFFFTKDIHMVRGFVDLNRHKISSKKVRENPWFVVLEAKQHPDYMILLVFLFKFLKCCGSKHTHIHSLRLILQLA